MALHAGEFFTQHLDLAGGRVVGDAYYVTPQPGSPLLMRIEFARTITVGEYDGLRVQILHTERGVLDTAILKFADHDTFRSRDMVIGREPGRDGYACIRDWHERKEPPWKGAATTKLRQAIEQYLTLWFPQDMKPPQEASPKQPSRSSHRKPPEPNGYWLTDPDFRSRLRSATHLLLDMIADGLNDDFTPLQVLEGARSHAADLLGIPSEYCAVIEAEAAAQIAGLPAGSPLGQAHSTAQALVQLEQRPVEEQEKAVRAALRRHVSTAPSTPKPAPALTRPGTPRTR
ncbi:hypothetical protein [Streptomyces sp. NPDC001508]|uniref:hypothetical protein n=1 Tax=Streptomyces sp. NPDC001508 TaxID=3154656 RepID=UPI00331CA301